MFRILDRYLIREIAVPFAIALVVFTFLLMIPVMFREAERFIAIGVPLSVVAQAMLLLLPASLSLSIPIAVLLGILVGFGRLAGDREFVAMQACGVSLTRLLRPVGLIALAGTAASAHQIIVALPEANQAFREIAARTLGEQIENSLRPRVLFQQFPNQVIYVRDVRPEGGWNDVFVADVSRPASHTVHLARQGRISVDREKRVVELQLSSGTSHTTNLLHPEEYQATDFETMSIALDPGTVFRPPPEKGAQEMTFAELDAAIAAGTKDHPEDTYGFRFMRQYKLSFPVTCPILALIGLALGASSRRDGRLASFVLGVGVVLIYYVLLYGARATALGGRLSPEWAPWIPNIVMAGVAVAAMVWRSRSADRPIRFSMPAWVRPRAEARKAAAEEPVTPTPSRPRVVIRIPRIDIPRPRLLDLYVTREYLRVFALAGVGLLSLFYISTFIDLVDKLFRGEATAALLARYFVFQTPQFMYFVIPMAVLIATLVTVGLMTRNSELLVMRACGISLYRTAVPLLLLGALTGGLLFALQEGVLSQTNREADRLERRIRGWPPRMTAASRQWLIGRSGEVYRYDTFDAVTDRFTRLFVYEIDEQRWGLKQVSYADEARFAADLTAGEHDAGWRGQQGWVRRLQTVPVKGDGRPAVDYQPYGARALALEPPSYFEREAPEAADSLMYGQSMSFRALQEHIAALRASGTNALPYMVALQRKLAFPLVTLIMTMLAVPFAVTTGRRGALYGIGIGIVLAILYWVSLSLFGALGGAGLLTPLLAAWAPNILFGAAAAYMILTVRT
jgi:LPS export ABC transporter permease LptF